VGVELLLGVARDHGARHASRSSIAVSSSSSLGSKASGRR
jgi:hypothetical protein